MKQIKTIQTQVRGSGDFDEKVNKYLREGWTLKRLFRCQGFQCEGRVWYPMLIAFLEKEVDPNEEIPEA